MSATIAESDQIVSDFIEKYSDNDDITFSYAKKDVIATMQFIQYMRNFAVIATDALEVIARQDENHHAIMTLQKLDEFSKEFDESR